HRDEGRALASFVQMRLAIMSSIEAKPPRFGAGERSLVQRAVARLLGDQHDVEDATQDAMLTAFQRRASFRGDHLFATWLDRIATATARLHLRAVRRRDARLELADTDSLARLAARGPSPEDQVIREQERVLGLVVA